MPYQTGTAANPADLKTVIETFAVARGWTLASGVLSKSGAHVRLTATGALDLKIEGALDAAFTISVSPHAPHIYVATGWPVTYFLSGFTDVDNIYCVLNYNVSKYQYLAFGLVTKYGTWTGGAWFSATVANSTNAITSMILSSDTLNCNTPGSPPGLGGGAILTDAANGSGSLNYNSQIRVEIDAQIWLSGWDGAASWASSSPTLVTLIARNPNLWNSQAVLMPYHLTMFRASNKRTLLGEIPHIRHLRIDNHEPGDVITLGADKWKLWPWLEKNSAARDGVGGSFHSGTFGWAIKYDGP